MSDHEKWVLNIRPECEYEDEICYEASINEVLEVVNSIKVDRAAGVDKVLSTMLHSASHGFLVRLTFSIAFCDIAKAYDSVCCKLFYTKLSTKGFWGKVVF